MWFIGFTFRLRLQGRLVWRWAEGTIYNTWSHQFIEINARAKNTYDKLIYIDIVDYLSSSEIEFNCVIAADVFIYLDNLSDVLRLIR